MFDKSRRLAFCVLLGLLAGCATAPQPTQAPTPLPEPARVEDHEQALDLVAAIPLDEEVLTGRLENGLTWYVRSNDEPRNRAELRLAVNVGSMQEDEDQRGLAHFVEHMAFNGTEHFEKQELIDQLERMGMAFGADVNAFTSFDETVYMLEVPTDDPEIMDTAFKILLDWAQAISFEGEEIDKERGVVIEEWRLGRGARARIRDQQLPITYHGSRYAERMVIGDKEILENAPHDVLRRFYRDWYRPDLMAVVAVGDFDAKAMAERIKGRFSGLERTADPRPRIEYPIPDHEQTLVSIVTDPEATSTSVTVGYKRPPIEVETLGDLRAMVVDYLYHGMMMDRLRELSRKPDPPYRFSYAASGDLGRTKSMYRLYAAVDDGGVERGLSTLLTEAKRVERFGFLASELDRSKVEILRMFENSYKERETVKSRDHASDCLSHFLDGTPQPSIEWMYHKVDRLIESIPLDEVNDRADQWLSKGNRIILVSGPESEADSLPTEEQLLAVFESASAVEVTPWIDQVRDEPLVLNPPSAGSIVEESYIEDLDLTRWRLSNGVEVWLKPTDFKNDQVLIRASSPGGYSLVDDDDVVSADLASSLVREMGLGSFSRIELDKALAGTVAGARGHLSELREGFGASGSPEDLETIFELIWLNVTAPRLDEDAAAAFLERQRTALIHNEASPMYRFGIKYNEVVTQDHPRRKPLTSEGLEEVDVHRALEIYRERFADCSDFVVTIVGAFELDQVRPLVERWIGGLPAEGRRETWRDPGVEFPSETVEFTVEAGIEAKSQVRMRRQKDAEWSYSEVHLVRSMAAALRIRLREVIREDLGGVYGVRVSANIIRDPRQEFFFSVGFGCDPDRVDELIAAVEAEIATFIKDGPDDDTVDKVQEIQRRNWEVEQRENRFWLGAIQQRVQLGLDPLSILDQPAMTENLTAEALRATAEKYLTTERRVLGVLLPEEQIED